MGGFTGQVWGVSSSTPPHPMSRNSAVMAPHPPPLMTQETEMWSRSVPAAQEKPLRIVLATERRLSSCSQKREQGWEPAAGRARLVHQFAVCLGANWDGRDEG